MQKISDITSTADENNEFTNGVVAAGKVPTILDAAWFNTIQRELVKVVEGAGLAINPPDDTQIYQAIKLLANGQIEIASDADIQNGIANKLVDAKGLFTRTETGRKPSFNQSFCDAIAGYPKGAILLSTDGITLWQNTIDANTTDPDSVGATGWALVSVKTPRVNIIKFENSGTYTPTPGAQFIMVEAVSGGGAAVAGGATGTY